VEKPFTSTAAPAEELIELAEKKNLRIMVDHTFLFTGAVKKIRDLVDERVLGKLYYYDATPVNLGLFQRDVNVVWDLAPHDLSIMGYLITQSALAARGSQDARNPDPGLQSVKDAQFGFDYSRLGPWEQHTARSVMRLVIEERGRATL
jgi:predicted dehydrogenase